MTNTKFDAEKYYERLFDFARNNRRLIEKLPKSTANFEYANQLIRSSSSIGSNYIEAIEATSKKDFIYRLKISRKETKESVHWLRLILDANYSSGSEIQEEIKNLINEGREIMRIFTASILTSEARGNS